MRPIEICEFKDGKTLEQPSNDTCTWIRQELPLFENEIVRARIYVKKGGLSLAALGKGEFPVLHKYLSLAEIQRVVVEQPHTRAKEEAAKAIAELTDMKASTVLRYGRNFSDRQRKITGRESKALAQLQVFL